MLAEGCLQKAVHNSNIDLSAAVAGNYCFEDFWAFFALQEEAGLKTWLVVLMGQVFVDELFEGMKLGFEKVTERDR